MTSLPTLVPGVNKGNPDCDGYRLKGTTRLGALFEQGDAANRVQLASPRGFAGYVTRISLPVDAWLKPA
jgi:hypothetical protein